MSTSPPNFLFSSIFQTPILGSEYIILGFPRFQQGFIPQIHQVAYLRSVPGKPTGLLSSLVVSVRACHECH